jgi:sialate O-acetylesterase
VGEARDIHPKDKQTPGERLARWALAKDYGHDGVWSSPLYKTHRIEDHAVVVTFDHVGEGLRARDAGPLKRFEIAGDDRKWHWADAVVTAKDAVTVRCATVPRPVAVRYAWASNPQGANLVNSENLPASVFRTDDWEGAEPLETPVTARLKQRDAIQELAEQIKKLPPKSEEAAAQRARLESLMKAFKDSAPQPAQAPK